MALPIPTNHVKRLSEIDEIERKLAIEKALTLEKAFQSTDVNEIYKAQQYWKLSQVKDRNGLTNAWPYQTQTQDNPLKALMIDPLQTSASQGYYNKRGVLSYENLRTMARVHVPSAIIKTRKNQVAAFLKPQADKYSPGFILEKIGITDDEEYSDSDKKERDGLTEFLLRCGDKTAEYKWDNLETFGRKLVDDSLTCDQSNAEIVPYRDGTPYCFAAVDAATMRIAASYDNVNNIEGLEKIKGEYPSYVQLYQHRPARLFYPWEMMWGVRNPQTSIYQNNYGRCELEDLVTTVTGIVNADRYNSGFFRQGSAPKGMLMVKKPGAALDGDRLAEFRRSWNAMIAGVGNCLDGSVKIWTKEFGERSIVEILGGKIETLITIWTGTEWQAARAFVSKYKTVSITRTVGGRELKTSPEHNLATLDLTSQFEWLKQKHFQVGDPILVNAGEVDWESNGTITTKINPGDYVVDMISELIATDEEVLMYDVEVYDDKHIFIANGIACSNSHKMPILDAESFEYIDFSKNSRDMEFYKFLEYLIKLLCALYTISPEEIGFPLEGAGHGGMGKGDGKEEKDYSKDKGLHPLLTHVETWFNQYIIKPKTNGKWRFRFVGIKQESAKEESERLQKEVTTITTPDEIRKMQGKKPLPDGVGKYPLSPIIAQQIMMKNQNQQDAQQQQYEQGKSADESQKEEDGQKNPFLEDESSPLDDPKNPFTKSYEEFIIHNLVKE